jgi:hypothetical protein
MVADVCIELTSFTFKQNVFTSEQGNQIGRILRVMGDCLLWVVFLITTVMARIFGLHT